MKIKWKILIMSVAIISIMTLSSLWMTDYQVDTLVTNRSKEELKHYSNMGMNFFDKYYVGDWSIKDGKLYKGDQLINDNFALIDDFTNDSYILATVFQNDTRIATNVTDDKGNRMVGTKASEIVIDTVLNKGEAYLGTADILGKSASTYYVPLRDKDGNVIGMWFVGVYKELLATDIDSTMWIIFANSILLLGLGVLVSYLVGNSITKGIRKVQENLGLMEEGNLNVVFEKKLLDSKNEVGIIARSVDNTQKKFADMLLNIQNESEKLKNIAKQTLDTMQEVHDNIVDISASTEQLSSSMEETSASAEEMTASTVEMESKISDMKEKTTSGEHLAKEIKQRAGVLKEETGVSRENAISIYNTTNNQLRESIKKAEAIEEIKNLSQTILQITAKTNLLALNASIEAARAGEAGKGFSVVADEISMLAQSSKQAVSQINAITETVSEAVASVVKDSQALLEFMDNQVLKDYEMLVHTSAQYDIDADQVSNVVTEINDIAELLYEHIVQMRQAIEEVTSAAVDGADGTQDIAGMVTTITTKADEVLQYARENKQSATHLDEQVDYFQI